MSSSYGTSGSRDVSENVKSVKVTLDKKKNVTKRRHRGGKPVILYFFLLYILY